jgi:REP element-mobilizing transposase RayT
MPILATGKLEQMPRYPRYECAGAIHHLVTQGTGRGRIVRDDRDRRAYLGRFYREASSREWLVHASSLLDTHHHAVVTTPNPDLGIGVGRIAGGHAAWFNARYGRSGALFSERFWSRRAELHLVRVCIYVFLNPVAAGVVDHPRDWRWSSYADVERQGCSADIAAITGGTEAFLSYVGDAVERIRALRAPDAGSCWRAIGDMLAHQEGRG